MSVIFLSGMLMLASASFEAAAVASAVILAPAEVPAVAASAQELAFAAWPVRQVNRPSPAALRELPRSWPVLLEFE